MAIRQLRIPNTLVLIFFIILLVGFLTWVIPAGEFDRAEKGGRTVVVPESYHNVEKQPQGIGAILAAPVRGFIEAANVIAFIFVVGGAFGIVNATGAINAGIEGVRKTLGQSQVSEAATIPVLMVLFSLGGATFGMSEEVLAFIFVFVCKGDRIRFDRRGRDSFCRGGRRIRVGFLEPVHDRHRSGDCGIAAFLRNRLSLGDMGSRYHRCDRFRDAICQESEATTRIESSV